MKKFTLFFLFCVLAIDSPLLLAQYTPQPQETKKSEQAQIITGTLIKIDGAKIWIIIRRGDVNSTLSFIINKETVIVGNLGIGKTVEVEYKRKRVGSPGRKYRKKTAVKITVLT